MIILKKYASTGDGILTAIKIMEVLIQEKTSLKEVLWSLKKYPQLIESVSVCDKLRIMNDKELNCYIEALKCVQKALNVKNFE